MQFWPENFNFSPSSSNFDPKKFNFDVESSILVQKVKFRPIKSKLVSQSLTLVWKVQICSEMFKFYPSKAQFWSKKFNFSHKT